MSGSQSTHDVARLERHGILKWVHPRCVVVGVVDLGWLRRNSVGRRKLEIARILARGKPTPTHAIQISVSHASEKTSVAAHGFHILERPTSNSGRLLIPMGVADITASSS